MNSEKDDIIVELQHVILGLRHDVLGREANYKNERKLRLRDNERNEALIRDHENALNTIEIYLFGDNQQRSLDLILSRIDELREAESIVEG